MGTYSGEQGILQVDGDHPRVDVHDRAELDRPVQESAVEMGPVDDPVRRPELLLKVRDELGQADRLARLPPTEIDVAGLNGEGLEGREEAPPAEEAGDVG